MNNRRRKPEDRVPTAQRLHISHELHTTNLPPRHKDEIQQANYRKRTLGRSVSLHPRLYKKQKISAISG